MLNQITDIVEPISKQLPKFLINNLIIVALFLLGILLGALIMRIFYVVATKKEYKKVDSAKKVESSIIYDQIIVPALEAYDLEYGNAPLKEKFTGYKKAFEFMLNNIAKTYYPKSQYPVFEVSADELIMLADKFAESLSAQLKRFLDDNFLVRNAFKAGIYMHNKGKKDILSYNWKEIKLSTIKKLVESMINKPEKEKKSFWSNIKTIPEKLLTSFLSGKIRELIIETGIEIDKVYSGKTSDGQDITQTDTLLEQR